MTSHRKSKTFPQASNYAKLVLSHERDLFRHEYRIRLLTCPRRSYPRSRVGTFHRRPLLRRSRRRLLHRLRPPPLRLQVGRHRLAHQRHPSRRLRPHGRTGHLRNRFRRTTPHRRSRRTHVQAPLATRVNLRRRPRDQSYFSTRASHRLFPGQGRSLSEVQRPPARNPQPASRFSASQAGRNSGRPHRLSKRHSQSHLGHGRISVQQGPRTSRYSNCSRPSGRRSLLDRFHFRHEGSRAPLWLSAEHTSRRLSGQKQASLDRRHSSRRHHRNQEWSFRKVGFSQSLASAANFTERGSLEILIVLKRLITGEMSAKQLQSVVGIASEAGHAVQEGTFAVITLMAALSLNLGILNLMPIPILDGGNILLLALEGIRRRDFSLAFKERFVQVGLVFLLVLFGYVMYNDVARFLPIHT